MNWLLFFLLCLAAGIVIILYIRRIRRRQELDFDLFVLRECERAEPLYFGGFYKFKRKGGKFGVACKRKGVLWEGYDDIEAVLERGCYGDFVGLKLSKDGAWGFVGEALKLPPALEWDEIKPYKDVSNGRIEYFEVRKGSLWGAAGRKGETLVPCRYERVYREAGYFFALVWEAEKQYNRYDLWKDGKQLLPGKYCSARVEKSRSPGYILAINDSGKQIVFDLEGKPLIDPVDEVWEVCPEGIFAQDGEKDKYRFIRNRRVVMIAYKPLRLAGDRKNLITDGEGVWSLDGEKL